MLCGRTCTSGRDAGVLVQLERYRVEQRQVGCGRLSCSIVRNPRSIKGRASHDKQAKATAKIVMSVTPWIMRITLPMRSGRGHSRVVRADSTDRVHHNAG